jgi:hypothetical protein
VAAAAAWGVRVVLPINHPLWGGAIVIAAYGAAFFFAAWVFGIEESDGVARRIGLRPRGRR